MAGLEAAEGASAPSSIAPAPQDGSRLQTGGMAPHSLVPRHGQEEHHTWHKCEQGTSTPSPTEPKFQAGKILVEGMSPTLSVLRSQGDTGTLEGQPAKPGWLHPSWHINTRWFKILIFEITSGGKKEPARLGASVCLHAHEGDHRSHCRQQTSPRQQLPRVNQPLPPPQPRSPR